MPHHWRHVSKGWTTSLQSQTVDGGCPVVSSGYSFMRISGPMNYIGYLCETEFKELALIPPVLQGTVT